MNFLKCCPLNFWDEKGLSLLEVSIVLAIMGIVGTTALPYLSKQRHQSRLTKTLAHQKILFASLANYAVTHGKLPCPAERSGKAKANCSEESAVGSIPYATLGLPPHYAQDGWGHDYIYAVNSHLTDIQHEGHSQLKKFKKFCSIKDSTLQIYRTFSDKIFPVDKDPFALVLVSRGEAGHHPKGKGEKWNEGKNLNFIESPYQNRPDAPHRHLLKWWTRDHLLAHHADFSCPGFMAKLKIQEELKSASSNESLDTL